MIKEINVKLKNFFLKLFKKEEKKGRVEGQRDFIYQLFYKYISFYVNNFILSDLFVLYKCLIFEAVLEILRLELQMIDLRVLGI